MSGPLRTILFSFLFVLLHFLLFYFFLTCSHPCPFDPQSQALFMFLSASFYFSILNIIYVPIRLFLFLQSRQFLCSYPSPLISILNIISVAIRLPLFLHSKHYFCPYPSPLYFSKTRHYFCSYPHRFRAPGPPLDFAGVPNWLTRALDPTPYEHNITE